MNKNLNLGKMLADRLKAVGFKVLKRGDTEPAEKPFVYLTSDIRVREADLTSSEGIEVDIELHAEFESDYDRLISVLNNTEKFPGAPYEIYFDGIRMLDGERTKDVYKTKFIYKFRQYAPEGEMPLDRKPSKEE